MINKLKIRMREVRPYSVSDYSAHANMLFSEFIGMAKSKHSDQTSEDYVRTLIKKMLAGNLGGRPTYHHYPSFAGKWSAISRKRRAGVLLAWLLIIECEELLDLTPTLASNLLVAMTGSSISNRSLIQAFGDTGRTAARKSKDFVRVEEISNKYKSRVNKSIKKYRDTLSLIKDQVLKDILCKMEEDINQMDKNE